MLVMLLAALQQVDKFYGDQVVLEQVGLELRSASRIALIGRNGAGKSTILKLLLGLEPPDSGTIYRREGVTLAMLEQDPQFDAEYTVLELSERAFTDLDVLEQELSSLENTGLHEPDIYERWEHLHEIFERRGGYERRARRDAVLYALGFRGREHEKARHLSGGEKTRLGLARLLMAQPDVLLLDEPTNHLDMQMREWLEGYLSRYPGAVMLVSHDRAFLDAACNQTAEIALATLRNFAGTPSQYRDYRAEQLRIEALTRANQHKEHQRLEAAAAQMKKWAGQNAKLHRRAKAMEKRVERYATQMLPEAERQQRATRFRFDCDESGEIVMQAGNLSKSFGDNTLFKDVNFTLRQGERIALIGPNGAGKSSFIKMLLGDLASDNPRAQLRFGVRVRGGYYDQDLRGVDPEMTLIEEMIRLVGDVEAHNLLGRFLFPYGAQYKTIAKLSGGERARLALLKLTMGNNNFLILDEPTNHLDVEMIEALEQALQNFAGTLLIVSHDRRFIEATTDFIWELREGRFTAYEGDWTYYQYKRQAQLQNQAKQAKAEQKSDQAADVKVNTVANKTPSKWQLERELEVLEQEIGQLEHELGKISERLTNPEGLAVGVIQELGEEHARLEADLLAAMSRWETASQLLSAKV